MKRFLKELGLFATVVALAFCMLACPTEVDNNTNPEPGPGPNPTVDALVEYLSAERIDISRQYNPANWWAPESWTAPRLTGNIANLVEGTTINTTFTYYAKVGDGESATPPYIVYKITAKNTATLDPYLYSQAEAVRVGAVIASKLSAKFSSNVNDQNIDGYVYYGEVTYITGEFPDDGVIVVTIPLVKDDKAGDVTSGFSSITAVSISGTTATISGASYTGSYDTVAHKLTITVPANGVTQYSVAAVAEALVTVITGKITNNDGYIAPLSASGILNGNNIVVTINLGFPPVPADTIANAISNTSNGSLTIAGSAGSATVTSAVIDALKNISGATETASAAYDAASKTVIITVEPTATSSFSAMSGFYDIAADGSDTTYPPPTYQPVPGINGLKRKLIITNNVDTEYAVIDSVTYAVGSRNLIFNVQLRNYIEATAIINGISSETSSAVTITSASSISGSIITKLGGITGVTKTATAAYNTTSKALTITLTAADGYQFNPNPVMQGQNPVSPYASVPDAVKAKIASITNRVDTVYIGIGNTGAEITGDGKLLLTFFLGQAVDISKLTSAISGAANGTLNTAYNAQYQIVVTGSVITALTNIPSASGLVTAATAGFDASYAPTSIVITIEPVSGYVFNTSAGVYDSVASALQTKLDTSISYPGFGGPGPVKTITGVTAAVTNGNLVLTIATP